MKKFKIESLEKEYFDPGTILFHASFQCLVNFVEKESGLRHSSYKDENQKIYIDQLFDLYYWWIQNSEDLDEDSDESQEKLEQLVKIRRYLWT